MSNRRNKTKFAAKDKDKFWRYSTVYDLLRSRCDDEISYSEFYSKVEDNALATSDVDTLVRSVMESEWIKCGRPYYRLWPKLVPYLSSFNDRNVKCDMLKLPFPVFGLYFRADDTFLQAGGKHSIRSVLFGRPRILDGSGASARYSLGDHGNLIALVDIGESYRGTPVCSWFNMPMNTGEYVHDVISSLKGVVKPSAEIGWDVSHEFMHSVMRIGVAICLMASGDDSVVSPVELKPATYYRIRGKQVLAKPAKFSKNSFDVGREFVVQPHWRNPSPLALYWTGKGRKVPLLRYRKGCVVRRSAVKVEFDGKSHQEKGSK